MTDEPIAKQTAEDLASITLNHIAASKLTSDASFRVAQKTAIIQAIRSAETAKWNEAIEAAKEKVEGMAAQNVKERKWMHSMADIVDTLDTLKHGEYK